MTWRRNYLLVLLAAIMVFNYVDRLALGLLLEEIKVDLHLSDTQLGLLTGIVFALFYALMGIPIARWADRGNRAVIVSVTAALWSIAVALCGAASSFLQLVVLRMMVAVGEAGCHPPALSLISDYFDSAERPRAIARYMLGWPVALFLGYFAAGWLNGLYGWRGTFVVLAAPGLFLAVLAAVTLKEPRSAQAAAAIKASSSEPTFKEVLVTLWSNRAFRHLLFFFSLAYFFSQGILQWQPAFFVRSHEMQTAALGTWLAVIYGGTGLIGTYLGGELVSRYAGSIQRQLLAIGALYAATAVLYASVYLAPTHHLAFAALTFSALIGVASTGPMFAATQTLVPPHMRAMSIALILFFSHLIGMGLGPLATGLLSDALQPWAGEESLRYALLSFCPGYFLCSWHMWKASRAIEQDVDAPALSAVATSSPDGWASTTAASKSHE